MDSGPWRCIVRCLNGLRLGEVFVHTYTGVAVKLDGLGRHIDVVC